jgi:hypothetical protein
MNEFIENIKNRVDKNYPLEGACSDIEIEEAFKSFDKNREHFIALASREEGFRTSGSYDVFNTKFEFLQYLLFYPYMQLLVKEDILIESNRVFFKK